MNMSAWNDWIISQHIRLGNQRAMLKKAKICIDRSNTIMVGLLHRLGR